MEIFKGLLARPWRTSPPSTPSNSNQAKKNSVLEFPSEQPALSGALQVTVQNYRDVLRNYECLRILGMKADTAPLDYAKLLIAEAILTDLGIRSYIDESEIRREQQDLERRGENPSPRREPIPEPMRWAVFRRDRFRCVECFRKWGLSVDHINPVSKGGLTVMENLQTLCKPCNSRKGDRT